LTKMINSTDAPDHSIYYMTVNRRDVEEYHTPSMDAFEPNAEQTRTILISHLDFKGTEFLPLDILYSIRTQCDLGCRYCYQGDYSTGQKDVLDLETALAFHKAASKRMRGSFSFWGGEPVYDLEETILWIQKLRAVGGKPMMIQTNGESIHAYDKAVRFFDVIKQEPRISPLLMTLCVDKERSVRYSEKYSMKKLEWAYNILKAWLDTCGPSNLCVRGVMMESDATSLDIVRWINKMIGIRIQSISMSLIEYRTHNDFPRFILAPSSLRFETKKGEYGLIFAATWPFRMGYAESSNLNLLFTDEVENSLKERGHPECGTHWVVKSNGDVAHCITLDHTGVHNIGNIYRDSFDAIAKIYNNDPILRILRDPTNRRATWWSVSSALAPEIERYAFNPIAPMCQFLFSNSALKLRVTKMLALQAYEAGEMKFVNGTPDDILMQVLGPETREDLHKCNNFIL
ncbi:MAG: 4Fe-4S cluster-binding domain-containing protein, partial [Candidatus ainarchaeum sp.]|nr:4Fe-4S cluster-binding domain-containing protein [Candidatus ainarchaeum sp.]